VTTVLDKLRPREELARGDLSSVNSVNFIRGSPPKFMTVSSSPAIIDFDDHTNVIRVSLRFD
jgi:hypothetical protein